MPCYRKEIRACRPVRLHGGGMETGMKRTIIVATGNQEKMVEIRQIFASTDVELITMKEAGIDTDVEENGATYEENALLKARAVAKASGQLAIADDSGLEVDAMGGEPGIHSARWMGHDTSYDIKNREIIRRVDAYCAEKEAGMCAEGAADCARKEAGPCAEDAANQNAAAADGRHPGCLPDGTPGPLRSARFVCAVAAVWPDGRELTVRGVMDGRIHTCQSGWNGFGYDPIFFLPEYGMTSGSIERGEKNRISHRGQAFRKLGEILKKEFQAETGAASDRAAGENS